MVPSQVELEVATDEPVAPLLVETDALDGIIQEPVDMDADDEVLQIGPAWGRCPSGPNWEGCTLRWNVGAGQQLHCLMDLQTWFWKNAEGYGMVLYTMYLLSKWQSIILGHTVHVCTHFRNYSHVLQSWPRHRSEQVKTKYGDMVQTDWPKNGSKPSGNERWHWNFTQKKQMFSIESIELSVSWGDMQDPWIDPEFAEQACSLIKVCRIQPGDRARV